MRAVAWVLIGLAGWLDGSAVAQAGGEPVIVIPGKRGVPVVINGFDASYCIVESEFGLERPGHMTPNIVACPLFAPSYGRGGSSYYPARGRRPGYGRVEYDDGRRPPRPAPSYHREWSTSSDELPATIEQPYDPVPVVVAPVSRRRPVRRRL